MENEYNGHRDFFARFSSVQGLLEGGCVFIKMLVESSLPEVLPYSRNGSPSLVATFERPCDVCKLLGARFYTPQVGRFTQRDPIGVDILQNCVPQTRMLRGTIHHGAIDANLYVYANNNSATLIDPAGTNPFVTFVVIPVSLSCAHAVPAGIGKATGCAIGCGGILSNKNRPVCNRITEFQDCVKTCLLDDYNSHLFDTATASICALGFVTIALAAMAGL